MSFMIVKCQWCDVTYTTGVVGMQTIGTGHRCEAHKPCDEPGCERDGTIQTAAGMGPDGIDEGRRFVCHRHIGDGIVVACQPRADGQEAQ